MQQIEDKPAIVDQYLWEISPPYCSGSITGTLEACAALLGVSLSTIHRWRAKTFIHSAKHVALVLRAVEDARRTRGSTQPITMEDVAALAGLGGRRET